MRGEEMVVALALIGGTSYVLRALIGLMGKRIDAKTTPLANPDTEQHLARIEQAVDAIAIEVERIAEGQRFTTRLLSERPAAIPSISPSGSSVRS